VPIRSIDLERKLATLLGWRETCARNLSGEAIWRTPEGTSETANWTRNATRAHDLQEKLDLSVDRQPGGALVSRGEVRAFAAYHEHPCADDALHHAIVVAAIKKLTLEAAGEATPTNNHASPSPGGP
jgi:hypothetical protein